MPRALALAIGDLSDRAIVAIVIRSLLVTLAIFAAVGGAVWRLLRGADPCNWLGLDACPLDGASSGIGAAVLTLALLWMLFPAVALGIVAGFAAGIVVAVERRHYPLAAERATRLGLWGSLAIGMRGSVRVLICNIVALPLYALLLVTGVGPVVLLALVNGLALATDLGWMVAVRHGGRAERTAWMRASRWRRRGIGVAVAGLFLVPVVNLLAPVLGAAAMTHLYHRRRG